MEYGKRRWLQKVVRRRGKSKERKRKRRRMLEEEMSKILEKVERQKEE